MLGIDDPQIWLAYVFCVLSALGCMVYVITSYSIHYTKLYEEKELGVSLYVPPEPQITGALGAALYGISKR